jgi:hypothetical protein
MITAVPSSVAARRTVQFPWVLDRRRDLIRALLPSSFRS